MRLEKELGALNSEILSIKEKWKIALNIDKKKIAIERLISMRRVRDSEKINSEIESAVKSEERKLEDLVVRDVERYEAVEQAKVRESVERELEVEETSTSQQPEPKIEVEEKRVSTQIDIDVATKTATIQTEERVIESTAKEETPQEVVERKSPKIEKSSSKEVKPAHLTVDWLKRRMVDKK